MRMLHLSRRWYRVLFIHDVTKHVFLCPHVCHWKDLCELYARSNQQPDVTLLQGNIVGDHLDSEIYYPTRQRQRRFYRST